MFVAGITLCVLGIAKETGQQPAWARVLSLVLSRKMPFGLGGEAKAFFFFKDQNPGSKKWGEKHSFPPAAACSLHSLHGWPYPVALQKAVGGSSHLWDSKEKSIKASGQRGEAVIIL